MNLNGNVGNVERGFHNVPFLNYFLFSTKEPQPVIIYSNLRRYNSPFLSSKSWELFRWLLADDNTLFFFPPKFMRNHFVFSLDYWNSEIYLVIFFFNLEEWGSSNLKMNCCISRWITEMLKASKLSELKGLALRYLTDNYCVLVFIIEMLLIVSQFPYNYMGRWLYILNI